MFFSLLKFSCCTLFSYQPRSYGKFLGRLLVFMKGNQFAKGSKRPDLNKHTIYMSCLHCHKKFNLGNYWRHIRLNFDKTV